MTLPLLAPTTITVQRATFDRFNDPTYVDHHDVTGCIQYAVVRRSASPSQAAELSVNDRHEVLAPANADVLPTDRVRMNGLLYQVIGLPMDWTDPFTGWSPGVQIMLERIS